MCIEINNLLTIQFNLTRREIDVRLKLQDYRVNNHLRIIQYSDNKSERLSIAR